MGKFASSKTQSASVIKAVQGTVIKSVGTGRNYEGVLKLASTFMKENNLGSLRDMTVENADDFLKEIAADSSQSKVDMCRQSIQLMMQNITNKLNPNETLRRILSENPTTLSGRAYKQYQIKMIAERQTDKYSLSTLIAYSAGLRAHELYTLRLEAEQIADVRNNPKLKEAFDKKWEGRTGVIWTTVGKGGLCRQVMIPTDLSNRLEELRLDVPRIVVDRQVVYTQHYNIGGGKNFSASFSAASQRALGWSTGAHGVRHSYAQERMQELKSEGFTRETALAVVSQELGHFRQDITEVYLR